MSREEPGDIMAEANKIAERKDLEIGIKNVSALAVLASAVYRNARSAGLDRTEAMMLAQHYMTVVTGGKP